MKTTRAISLDSDRLRLYALYWAGYLLLFTLVQGLPANDLVTSFINELVGLPLRVLFVLLVAEWLAPRLLTGANRWMSSAAYILAILSFAFLQRLIDNFIILPYMLPHWGREPLFSMPPFLYNVIKLQFVVTLPVCVQLFYQLAEARSRAHRIQSEKLVAELQLLRSQLQPHFIFNVLNNLYSRIMTGTGEPGKMVLDLAALLRHTVYEASEQFIPLEREIDYLHHYISLQRQRFTDLLEVSVSVTGPVEGLFIEPFLIMPFVENSFKFGGAAPGEGRGWITVFITVMDQQLLLKVENSLPPEGNRQPGDTRSGGFGLSNVRRRLELLYPGRHELLVRKSGETFFISLKLQLDTADTLPDHRG
jgi:two-component system LytT family sensor kinase